MAKRGRGLGHVTYFSNYGSVTGRASGDPGLGSLDDTFFVARLSRVRNYSD